MPSVLKLFFQQIVTEGLLLMFRYCVLLLPRKKKQKAIVTSYWAIPLMENSISYLLFLSTQIIMLIFFFFLIMLIFTQQLLLLRSLCNITSSFCITYPGKVHQLRSTCKSQGISPLSHPTDSSSHVPLCLLLLKISFNF